MLAPTIFVYRDWVKTMNKSIFTSGVNQFAYKEKKKLEKKIFV